MNVQEAAARAPASVLLVDDNPAKRLALSAVLAPLGYSIVEADSGLAALRCLLVQDFAVILLDVRMPDMDGFETAGLIRERRQSEMTPIIFVTAHASDEVVQRDRYAAGAGDYICAPVDPDELRAKVSVFAGLFRRAEELAARAREVQASADQLRVLTDAAPIGIFQTDERNRYVYTNPHWSAITGIAAEVALGQGWDTIFGAEQNVDPLAPAPVPAELRRSFEIRFPKSASRIVLVTSRPIVGRHGETVGWVGTLADITAEVTANLARDEQIRAKDDFLSRVSHELRSPLSVVHQFTSLLIDGAGGPLTDDQREFLGVSMRNVGQLKSMIDDLLEVTRADSGRLKVDSRALAIGDLLAEVTAGYLRTASEQGIDLALVCGNLPLVLGDPERLHEILANLIENALKFTPDGGRIAVEAVSRGSHVCVTVRDTGCGLLPQHQDRIFEQFFQVDGDSETSRSGLGLGLYICRDLIERQGGAIWAVSTLGSGTAVSFTVPIRHTRRRGDRQES